MISCHLISSFYRFTFNAGSWFVLERWISDVPFQSAYEPGQSDLDVARGANARQTLEMHWNTWVKDSDWPWFVEKGINTVRIPVGFLDFLFCSDAPTDWRLGFHATDWVLSFMWSRSFCA
jgi:aryl-phospho-beta-D-glucosidase BglC (GH1 family)